MNTDPPKAPSFENMDNRVFNVNGRSKEMLRAAITLAYWQRGERTTADAYVIDLAKGMILLWHNHEPCQKFDKPMSADEVTDFVWDWLQIKPPVECIGYDTNYDDGKNPGVWTRPGWRVYCEGWGHVGDNHYAIVAVKPAYMWIGK